MNAVTSPSRFARINRRVHYPSWGELVSHDVPFADGHNGEIAITITAKTPLLVGNGQERNSDGLAKVLPFKGPDGNYAIPSSSLQGVIRSILEVATFGKLGPGVENRRYAVRDIGTGKTAEALYRKRMTSGDGNQQPIASRVKTGWLVMGQGGSHAVIPCGMARIEMTQIATGVILRHLMREGQDRDTKQWKDADKRYAAYLNGQPISALDQIFYWPATKADRSGPHRHSCGKMSYEKCQKTPSDESFAGTLVLTGKAQATINARGEDVETHKIMEFVFHAPSRSDVQEQMSKEPGNVDSLPWTAKFISADVWRDFLLVHQPDKGSGGEDNPNWAYWRPHFKARKPVPIFYIEEAGAISAIGTAQLFKLAMPLSNHDMLKNSSPEHVSTYDGNGSGTSGRLDLASLIFGATGGRKGDWFRHNLKRRASFDLARIAREGQKPAGTHGIGPVALLSPKPSYYPIYVRQPQAGVNRQHQEDGLYAAYAKMPGPKREHSNPELAGVKIWPSEGRLRNGGAWGAWPPHLTQEQSKLIKVLSWLDAVPEGSSFTTTMRVHNLREVELGALLWALSFGQPAAFAAEGPALRHRLGGGKPYGLGEVEIRIGDMRLDRNDGKPPVSGPELVKVFTGYMDKTDEVGGEQWANSPQVKSLIKAATAQSYNGLDALDYIATPKRHADLRNGRVRHENGQPGGNFLPSYVNSTADGEICEIAPDTKDAATGLDAAWLAAAQAEFPGCDAPPEEPEQFAPADSFSLGDSVRIAGQGGEYRIVGYPDFRPHPLQPGRTKWVVASLSPAGRITCQLIQQSKLQKPE